MTLGTAAILSLGGAVVLGVLAVSEVVVRRAGPSDRVTILYWEKWTGAEAEEMRKTVNAFNRSQDRIFVKYLSISGVEQKTLLATSGGNPPDVAGLYGANVCQYADANALVDLTPLARQRGIGEADYIPCYWDMGTYRGKLWALPSTPVSIAMHVNADLVPKEFASPATFPATFEGLDRLTERITRRDRNGTLAMAGFLPGEPGWWPWAWPYWFGGKLMAGDAMTVDTPEARRAFHWIDGYGKRFGVSQVQSFSSGFGNFASSQDAFMSGKVASVLQGVFKANFIRLYQPKMRWFALPFAHPEDRPDLASRTIVEEDVLCVPRGAKHPREAFEFIAYVQRQDVMERLCSAHGKNSPLTKVSAGFFAHHPNPYARLFDRLARGSGAFHSPKVGIFPQLSSEMTNAYEEVSTGAKSPEQALAAAQARVDGLWRTYREQVLKG